MASAPNTIRTAAIPRGRVAANSESFGHHRGRNAEATREAASPTRSMAVALADGTRSLRKNETKPSANPTPDSEVNSQGAREYAYMSNVPFQIHDPRNWVSIVYAVAKAAARVR